MIKADVPTGSFAQQAIGFVRDFAAFAGANGVWGATLAVVAAIFESVGLVLLVPLLSIVTAANDNSGWIHRAVHLLEITGTQTRTARLSLLLSIFAGLLVLRALVVARRDITLARLQMGFVEQVRARIAQSLAAAPWPVVSRLQHARVTHLMGGDIQRIGGATNFLVQFLAALVLTAFQVAISFLLAPALAGMALALIVIGVLASFVMLGRAHRLGAQLSRTGIALMHETTQFLGGLKLAAAQNRQADFVSEFKTSLAALKTQQLAFVRQQALNRLAATIISGLVGALIAFIGLTVFNTPPPVLITMLLIFARISGPAMQMSQGVQQFAHTLPAHAEVCQLELELAAAEKPKACPSPARIAPGPIVFRNVSFRYQQTPSRGPIVDLSLAIEPGSFVGVSGPSGVGKTTFADLLVGLLEPEMGEIAVGGTPLRGAAAVSWRDHVSYVAQDPYLFRDSIRRNLLWASPQASEADLWEALAIAGADVLVRSMQSGLDTLVGERGSLVSGGERQRLCLARAVLRRPWLFLLDEATSAIDVPAERGILKRILELTPRPTIVMIAHRDESLSSCDRILRFERGRLLADAPPLAK
jgi:ABC-type multidrug transport system fused ATPase/permease subunit